MRPLLIASCLACTLACATLATVLAQSGERRRGAPSLHDLERLPGWRPLGAVHGPRPDHRRQRVAAGGGVDVSRPAQRTFMFDPLVADGLVFVLAGANDLVALDAATGAKVWSRPHPGAVGTRGLNYWRSADGTRSAAALHGRRIPHRGRRAHRSRPSPRSATTAASTCAPASRRRADRSTASVRCRRATPDASSRTSSSSSLPAQAAGYDSNPGDVHAYDVRTGALRWVFHSLPADGEPGADTWPAGARANARRRAQLERADDRRGARHRLRAVRHRPLRLLRRRPPGTEPVRQQPRGARRAHGQAAVALPDRPSRRVGLRPARGAEAADDPAERPAARRGGAAHQAGLPLRLRSRHRRADLADRGAARAAVGRARRAHVAHAARSRRSRRRSRGSRSPRRTSTRTCPPRSAARSARACAATATKGCSRRRASAARSRCPVTAAAPTGAAWPSIPIAASSTCGRSRCRRCCDCSCRAGASPGACAPGPATIVSAEEVARLTRQASEALPKGPVRFTSPYDFMFTSTYLSPIGPPWSEIVAYDLNTGDIKWRVPHGTRRGAGGTGIPADSGAHWPRGGLLATGGGLLFAASGSDKTLRAYDRRTGTGGLDATAARRVRRRAGVVRDRRPSVHRAAGGGRHGWNPARFPTLPPPPDGAYIAFALPK